MTAIISRNSTLSFLASLYLVDNCVIFLDSRQAIISYERPDMGAPPFLAKVGFLNYPFRALASIGPPFWKCVANTGLMSAPLYVCKLFACMSLQPISIARND